ncbi:MAG: glycosyltransferase [Ignavibacteria bacterium]|nr:glycosyltransferase [Ignavibacteria bacterium]
MKKLLVITYYWPPSGGVGVQRILKFVKYLPQFGILPYVITVREDKASYPSLDRTLIKEIPDIVKVYRTDTTEPFGIYSKLLGKKSIPTGFSNEGNPGNFQKFSRFIRGNLFIPDARKGWVRHAFEKAKELIEKENIDTVLTTSPPHSSQLIGLKLKKEYRINWIADLRDPWTDIHYYNEFRHMGYAKNLDLNYERSVFENADKIITVSNSFKELFVKKSDKIDPSKIFVITNGFDSEDFTGTGESSGNEFIITVTGTMPENYNPYAFIDSLKEITDEYKDVSFKLRIVGSAASSVTDYISKIGLDKNFELIQTVTHDKAVEYLLKSTILFLVIPQFKNEKGLIPAKLFEYLAARKTIVCLGPLDCEAAAIIDECNAGKTFDRNMKTRLTDYLRQLVNQWKVSKNLDVKNNLFEKHSRYNQAKELAGIILNRVS